MKRGLLVFGLAGAALLSGLAYQSTDSRTSSNSLEPPHKLVIAVSDNLYPFSYISKTTGERMGFDVELAQTICEKMKNDCRIVPLDLKDILVKLKNKQIDIAVAALNSSPERLKYLAFSETYFRSRSLFITNDPKIGPIERSDLSKLHIGVLRNSTQHRRLMQDYGDKGVDIIPIDTNAELREAMNNRTINMWLLDGVSGYTLLKHPAGLKYYIAGNYPDSDSSLAGYKIAVNRDNRNLLVFINEVLVQMQASGRYQELTQKYFPSVSF